MHEMEMKRGRRHRTHVVNEHGLAVPNPRRQE